MARRRRAEKRESFVDPIYKDLRVGKMINMMMKGGKKSLSERIVYQAFAKIDSEEKKDPLRLFLSAYENVLPTVEVKSRRVGGASYAVPMELRPERSSFLALHWIIKAARSRSEKTMVERLAFELVDASYRRGEAYKTRESVHRSAEANRAFAHFRW